MTDPDGPVVSFQTDAELKEKIADLADLLGVSQSELWRNAGRLVVGKNADALGLSDDERKALEVSQDVQSSREEIKKRNRAIDHFGGFPGRVADDMEARFKSGYVPKALAAKAESYVEEAKMLEEKVPEHPHAPPIDEGELVEAVEREVRAVIDAADLSNWSDRRTERYEQFEGVETAREARRFALVLTQRAMALERDLEPLRSSTATERHVVGSDLPELADEDLPRGVDREAVADAARRLLEMGHTPDQIPTDPDEFDPYGWQDTDAVVTADGSTQLVTADGTGRGLPTAENDTGAAQSEATETVAQTTDDVEDERDDVLALYEWAVEKVRDYESNHGAEWEGLSSDDKRDRAAARVADQLTHDETANETLRDMQATMNQNNLTPEHVAETAKDYLSAEWDAAFGDADDPELVRAEGGVRLE